MVVKLSKWALRMELVNALKSYNVSQVAKTLALLQRNNFPKRELRIILSNYMFPEDVDKIMKNY